MTSVREVVDQTRPGGTAQLGDRVDADARGADEDHVVGAEAPAWPPPMPTTSEP